MNDIESSTKADNEEVDWIEITEYNDWEGETWHHFFPYSEEHYRILEKVIDKHQNDGVFNIQRTSLSWKTAEILTNYDDGGYMQAHWFGELTNLEGLINAVSIYKGKIRFYGKELFSYDESE